LTLGQAGKRVVLADLDLGGSNLHLILGQRNQQTGIGVFLNNPKIPFDSIICKTDYENVRFIPGDNEIPGIANVGMAPRRKLIARLLGLDTDYLILDLGAGTSAHTLDFFLLSRHGIIVSTPAPTAVVNAYLFLKNAVFRILQQALKRGSPGAQLIDSILKDAGSVQKVYVQDLIQKINAIDPEGAAAIKASFASFQPRLVFNMIEDPKDSERATKLRRSCMQYLGIDLEHLGIMYRDDVQDTALQSGLPVVAYKPKSILSQALYRIADKILQADMQTSDDLPAVQSLDESYEVAGMEADIDFQTKLDDIDELVQSGALSTGDLIETIRSQQLEIRHIRKENTLLKAKILRAASEGYHL